jgi:hypothetical protein
MFETRTPPPLLPSSLVADPTEEAFEERSSKIVVALDRVLAEVDTVSGYKVMQLA